MLVESPFRILSELWRNRSLSGFFFLNIITKYSAWRAECVRLFLHNFQLTAFFFPLNKLIYTVTNMHINTQPLQIVADKVCWCVFYLVSLVWEEEGLNVTEHKYSAALTNLFGLPEATDVAGNARSADKKTRKCSSRHVNAPITAKR